MGDHFDLRRVLRQTSNSLLKLFFAKLRVRLDLDWDRLRETRIEPLFDAIQQLPDGKRQEVELALQDIHAMASEKGINVLVHDGDTWGKDLRDGLEKFDSRYDKAIWTYLNHNDVWSLALQFARVDQLAGSRAWVRRDGLPKKAPRIGGQGCDELAETLCEFYRRREGRGHRCEVEHHVRCPLLDFFFVYLSDHANTYLKLSDRGKGFDRISERRAFSDVFVYDRSTGALDVYAAGGAKVIRLLQEIFCRVILGEELPPEEGHAPPFHLGVALVPGFDFPVDPADGIDHVRIRRLRLKVKGCKRRIELEADPQKPPNDAHWMMAEYLNNSALPPALLDVDRLTLSFHMKGVGDGGRPATFSCSVSPWSCDLKNRREENRQIGEKCLRSWRIARA